MWCVVGGEWRGYIFVLSSRPVSSRGGENFYFYHVFLCVSWGCGWRSGIEGGGQYVVRLVVATFFTQFEVVCGIFDSRGGD